MVCLWDRYELVKALTAEACYPRRVALRMAL